MMVASTPRLILRQFIVSDHMAMTEVFGDPEVMRFGRGPQSPDWVRAWIDRQTTNYERLGYGLWAVQFKTSPAPIGYCGLTRFDDINGRPETEVGYRLAKRHWGQGLATEAATAVRDLAFQQLGIPKLIALIDPDNQRSIRVAEKIGMNHTDNVLLPGYTHPDRVYSIAPQP